ncbi:hypothetical protein [Micromonospora sp. B9E7]|uniref:hypothetical protein n=1 Tax=Micromonospora sp. B9E7 TaxID=3153574 RepID=UPI00325D3831
MLYATYAVLPVLDGWKAAFVWAAAALSGLLHNVPPRRPDRWSVLRGWASLRLRSRPSLTESLRPVMSHRNLATVLGVLLLAVVAFYGTTWIQKVATLWNDDRLSVILSGFLLAVFAGNLIVARVVRPYFNALTEPEHDGGAGLLPLGTYLGWIERALVFIFIATGQPEAAALAITVKSLVRLPEVREQRDSSFSQYVMMGTLTSLLVAVGAGIAVRIALGLPAL